MYSDSESWNVSHSHSIRRLTLYISTFYPFFFNKATRNPIQIVNVENNSEFQKSELPQLQ